jgi:hypothetical protein
VPRTATLEPVQMNSDQDGEQPQHVVVMGPDGTPVGAAPLDEASRNRLREIHMRSIAELEDGLAPELREELERLSLPFTEDNTPSDAELRIAQAQLVGWLEGLFHGIQTALFAQQMAARVQLEQMRRGLPPGTGEAAEAAPGLRGTGQYL